MEPQPKIVEVSYGLASSYGDVIEINRNLVGDLKDKILKHELRHGRNRAYSREDIKNDFQSENSYFFESLKFCLSNPTALIGFFPLMWSYYFKEMTFNWSSLIPFGWFGLLFSLFWWGIFHINPIQSFICYTVVVLLGNVILLGLTHYIIKKSGVLY